MKHPIGWADLLAGLRTNGFLYIASEDLNEIFKRIEDVLAISDNDVFTSVLTKKLDVEFSGQVNNIFTDESGEITLQIKNNSVTIKVEDNTVQSISENLHLNTEVIYIDDPFIILLSQAVLKQRFPILSLVMQ